MVVVVVGHGGIGLVGFICGVESKVEDGREGGEKKKKEGGRGEGLK